MRKISLTNYRIETEKIIYQIPWRYEAHARNMIRDIPTENISVNDRAWRSRFFKKAAEITSLFIFVDLDEQDYEMIGKINNLRSLYIYSAKNLKNIFWIEHLNKLRSLVICHSQISDLAPVAALMKKQSTDKTYMRLNCIAMIDSRILELTPLKGMECFDEFLLEDSLIPKSDPIYKEIMKQTYFFDYINGKCFPENNTFNYEP